MKKIIIGLPKGSLQEATLRMFKKAGFTIETAERSYIPTIDDPEIEVRLIRAQEISRYVEHGLLDAGITGYDWIMENNSDIFEVANLVYAKQGFGPVRWVVAVPINSPIKTIGDLAGKRIATEVVELTRRFLKKQGVEAEIEFSWGASEIKAPEFVDAIVELTETGSSLRANNLRILETVLESSTKLIANHSAWQDKWKRKKIEQVAILLQGALAAKSEVLLKMNVSKANVKAVTSILPALHTPTINNLIEEDWVAVESVVSEEVVREIIPKLKKAGASGIIEIPLNEVIE